jgi:small subunit ribosomal protein S4
MSRYTGPKNRIARRFGANIFGKARNPLLHKPNPAGMHGAKHKKKSDYGILLEEQQKLKAVYGMMSRKQLLKAYTTALKQHGNTDHNLLSILESRLDNVVYKLRFASTIFAAQQLISHGHIRVNGKKVDRKSFKVTPGMTISLSEKASKMAVVKAAQEATAREIPAYLELPEPSTGKMITIPQYDQISLPIVINISHVCEFLAHAS